MSYFHNFILKIKKSSFNRGKILFFGLIIFGFLFFPFLTKAAWYDFLINAFLFIPTLAIGIILGVAIMISGGFAWLSGAFLDWVTGPNFISFSFTNPGGENPNPIIASGLSITQSLVNMFLVVVLIYIAVSIALRLAGETEAKKMLVRLIFIALIVNFAPVICGLIVDASNIVMNYFLVGIREGVSGVLSQAWEYGKAAASAAFKITGSPADKFGLFMMGAIQIILNLSIAFAFLLYAGIFFFRYFAIWILVILAPLAFVFWITPTTRKFWDMWWNNFLQWSIIGIPMAFFLYLGMKIFGDLRGALIGKIELPGLEPGVGTLMDKMLPFLAVVVFLYLGFVIGLQTSAMGGSAAISLTKKGLRGAARFTGTVGKKAALWGLQKATKGKGIEWAERQAAIKPGEVFGESKAGKIIAKAGWAVGLTPAAWAVRRGLGEAGLRLTEAEIKGIRTAEEKYKGTTAERKLSALRDPKIFMRDRVGILRQAIEEEQIKDLRRLGLTDEEITKIGKTALRAHPEQFKKIRDAFPHLAEEMGKGFAESVRKAADLAFKDATEAAQYGTIEAKIVAKIKPAFIPKMDESTFESPETKKAIHNFWTGEQMGSGIRTFGRKFVEDFNKEAETILSKDPEFYKKNNFSLYKFSKSTPGRSLGMIELEK